MAAPRATDVMTPFGGPLTSRLFCRASSQREAVTGSFASTRRAEEKSARASNRCIRHLHACNASSIASAAAVAAHRRRSASARRAHLSGDSATSAHNALITFAPDHPPVAFTSIHVYINGDAGRQTARRRRSRAAGYAIACCSIKQIHCMHPPTIDQTTSALYTIYIQVCVVVHRMRLTARFTRVAHAATSWTITSSMGFLICKLRVRLRAVVLYRRWLFFK
jgi:hypothetical protein